MIIAIVPAAGRSERMGQPKLLLPVGGRPVIERVLEALQRSGVDRTVVVLPPGLPALQELVDRWPVETLVLGRQTPDMRASVQQALAYAAGKWAEAELEAFLLVPADHPNVPEATIERLISRFRQCGGEVDVVVPTYGGRRGHPVLFAWRLAARVPGIPEGRGLNYLLGQPQVQVAECDAGSRAVLEDMDTPQDYRRIRASQQADG